MPDDKIDDLVGTAYQSMDDQKTIGDEPPLARNEFRRFRDADHQLYCMIDAAGFRARWWNVFSKEWCEPLPLMLPGILTRWALEERRIGERERARADAAEKRAEAAEERAKQAATFPAKKPCGPECDCWSYDFH